MQRFVILTVLIQVLLGATSFAADQGNGVGNGGDAIEIGRALRIFDEAECEEIFFPFDLPEVGEILRTQLSKLEAKLPKTGAFLQQELEGSFPLWCYVTPQLREINDEGPTNLYLTFQKFQIAANGNGRVQINRPLWDRLEPRSKALLLIHEILWIAMGPAVPRDGSGIRTLATLLMNPHLDRLAAGTISDFVTRNSPASDSFLSGVARFDRLNLSTPLSFDVSEHASELGMQTIVTGKDDAALPAALRGLKITTFRPNPRYENMFFLHGSTWTNGDGSVATSNLERTRLSVDLASGAAQSLQTVENTDALCTGLSYGGQDNWRLPTREELQMLIRAGLFRISYPGNIRSAKWFGEGGRISIYRPGGDLLYPQTRSRSDRGGTSLYSYVIFQNDRFSSVLASDGSENDPFWQVESYVEYLCVTR